LADAIVCVDVDFGFSKAVYSKEMGIIEFAPFPTFFDSSMGYVA